MSSFYLPHRDILSLTKHKNKIDDLIEKKPQQKMVAKALEHAKMV